MFMETLKTGAWHRFFCVEMKFAAVVFCFAALQGRAQIVLPDDPELENRQAELVQPPEAETTSEEELNQLIQNLQGSQRPFFNFEEEQTPSSSDASLLRTQEERYETAPEVLKVAFELVSGESFWGEMKNRSFQVRNKAGDFPVLLHQLESIRAGEVKGTFTFRFSGGDFLEGTPRLDLLNVRLPDGGERLFRLNELKAVKVVEK